MGQGSGHSSYHGSMPVEDDVEETSPVKPKKPSRRATKAKDKGKKAEPTKKAEPWTTKEETALWKAWVHVCENCLRGNLTPQPDKGLKCNIMVSFQNIERNKIHEYQED